MRILDRKILEVVAPEVAEDHERRALEGEERQARRHTRLSFRRRGDGTTEIHARVCDAIAARLRTYLEAFINPRRDHDETAPREPAEDGSATTLVVTISLDQLRRQVGAACIGSGIDGADHLSATDALRLACTAKIVPVVLGGKAQPLHLGRARRFYNDAQRLAMTIRDGTCRAEGCDIPADWCDAHHAGDPWCRGGNTDIEEGKLLCCYHHHLAHDPDHTTQQMAGRLRFSRRTRAA